MNEFVTGSNSFAQKVFHSDLFKGWWKEAIQGQQEEGPEDDYQTGTGIPGGPKPGYGCKLNARGVLAIGETPLGVSFRR